MKAADAILEVAEFLEGSEYTEDPDPTRFGITQGVLDRWNDREKLPRGSVRTISRDKVIAIYDVFYWRPLKCSQLPNKIDFIVFQMGVNIGIGRAAKILQTAVGTTADGIIGTKTIAAAKLMPVNDLAEKLLQAQNDYYNQITTANQDRNGKYLRGWLNRVEIVRNFINNSPLAVAGQAGIGIVEFLIGLAVLFLMYSLFKGK